MCMAEYPPVDRDFPGQEPSVFDDIVYFLNELRNEVAELRAEVKALVDLEGQVPSTFDDVFKGLYVVSPPEKI